jgi:hypothetical protein
MTQHDTTVRIRHMLDHAKEAVDLLAGKEKADLSRDRILPCLTTGLVIGMHFINKTYTMQERSKNHVQSH